MILIEADGYNIYVWLGEAAGLRVCLHSDGQGCPSEGKVDGRCYPHWQYGGYFSQYA